MSKLTTIDGGIKWTYHSGYESDGRFFLKCTKENMATGDSYTVDFASMVKYVSNLKEEDMIKYVKQVMEGFSE